jgi:hypothetical protein
LVEVVNDDTDEKVQGEERPKDDENNKVDVHVEVVLPLGLLFILRGRNQRGRSERLGWVGEGHLWGEGVSTGRLPAQVYGCEYRVGPEAGGIEVRGGNGDRREQLACWAQDGHYVSMWVQPLGHWEVGVSWGFRLH